MKNVSAVRVSISGTDAFWHSKKNCFFIAGMGNLCRWIAWIPQMFLSFLFIKNRCWSFSRFNKSVFQWTPNPQHPWKAPPKQSENSISTHSNGFNMHIPHVVLCKQLSKNNNVATGFKVAHSNLHTGKIAHAALLSQNVFHLDSRPHWLSYPHGTDSSLSLAPQSADEVI